MIHPRPVRIASWLSVSVLAAMFFSALGARAARADEPAPPSLSPGAPASGAGASAVAAPIVPLSDHDAVVGHWGIEARRFSGTPFPLTLSPLSACPQSTTIGVPCTTDMGAISVRYWKSRNMAWNGGLAFVLGGGRQGSLALDTYYGVGPIVGVSLLLGNWRHLAVSASPEASFVYFKPSGGNSTSTKLVTLRAELEAELHFGFIDVPALSIGLTAGLVFAYESAPGASTWSVSVTDAQSVWGTLTNLFIRYYL